MFTVYNLMTGRLFCLLTAARFSCSSRLTFPFLENLKLAMNLASIYKQQTIQLTSEIQITQLNYLHQLMTIDGYGMASWFHFCEPFGSGCDLCDSLTWPFQVFILREFCWGNSKKSLVRNCTIFTISVISLIFRFSQTKT